MSGEIEIKDILLRHIDSSEAAKKESEAWRKKMDERFEESIRLHEVFRSTAMEELSDVSKKVKDIDRRIVEQKSDIEKLNVIKNNGTAIWGFLKVSAILVTGIVAAAASIKAIFH